MKKSDELARAECIKADYMLLHGQGWKAPQVLLARPGTPEFGALKIMRGAWPIAEQTWAMWQGLDQQDAEVDEVEEPWTEEEHREELWTLYENDYGVPNVQLAYPGEGFTFKDDSYIHEQLLSKAWGLS